eukprot:comp23535_c0_seq1/m.39632 comp23535_c0_seq1/g.39632  ORF comp23535_c0_seq1/g.39632 comp23535_c0_seq1/m.39632 type:complete len:1134 (-) comp23535_c0_seq1:21-3422(-)
MKFGKRLQTQHYLEWERHYINYKALKKNIKTIPHDDSKAFFFALDRELEKVTTFYTRKVSEFQDRLVRLCKRSNICLGAPHVDSVTAESLLTAFHAFLLDISMMKEFVSLNSTGFRKILKKHDKVLRQKTQELYLSSKVYVQPFTTDAKTLQDMQDEAERHVERLAPYVTGALTAARSAPTQSPTGDKAGQLLDAVGSQQEEKVRGTLVAISADAQQGDNREAVAMLTGPALLKACKQGYLGIVRILLDSGNVDINFMDPVNSRTALHRAAAHGHREVMVLLQEKGADLCAVDAHGRLALHHAAMNGHAPCLQLLLPHHQNPSYPDSEGYTPMFYALVQGATECVRVLLDAGVEVDGLTGLSQMTPLHVAAQYGHASIVDMLLKRGAQPDSTDENGCTPLHLAARAGHQHCVLLLAQHGADVNKKETNTHWSPLFEAASEGHLKCVEILLEHSACPEEADLLGWRPHVHALYHGHMDIAQLLKARTRGPLSRQGSHTGSVPQAMDIDTCTATDTQPAATQPAPADTREEATPLDQTQLSGQMPGLSLQGDDDTHQDPGIPPFALPPPALPFRHYGHTYLKNKCQIIISMGEHCITPPQRHRAGKDVSAQPTPTFGPHASAYNRLPTSASMPITFFSSKLDFLSLRMVISLNGSEMDQHLVMLPIEDTQETYSFYADSVADFTLQFDILPAFGSRQSQLIGRAIVLPSALAQLKGTLTCPIVDSHLQAVGSLSFEYTIIKPLDQPLSTSAKIYWKATKLLEKTEVPRSLALHTTNALVVEETSLDARYIKFSVQITRDGVAVIHNQPTVAVSAGPGLPRVHLPISSLTSDQFRAITTPQQPPDQTTQYYPTLADALKEIPVEIGFKIHMAGWDEGRGSGDVNSTVDVVLGCIYAYAQSRPIILSSPSPDVCLYLGLKQPNYPVFFTTTVGEIPRADPRSYSIQRAIRFAKANFLLGIDVPGWLLQDAPILAGVIKESGLLLFTHDVPPPDPTQPNIPSIVDGVVVGDVVYVGQKPSSMDPLYQFYASALRTHQQAPSPKGQRTDRAHTPIISPPTPPKPAAQTTAQLSVPADGSTHLLSPSPASAPARQPPPIPAGLPQVPGHPADMLAGLTDKDLSPPPTTRASSSIFAFLTS